MSGSPAEGSVFARPLFSSDKHHREPILPKKCVERPPKIIDLWFLVHIALLALFLTLMVVLVDGMSGAQNHHHKEKEFGLDERGNMLCKVIRHVCLKNIEGPQLRLKASTNHSKITLFANPFPDECMGDSLVLRLPDENIHEIWQLSWTSVNDDPPTFEWKEDVYHGYFPLHEESFIWKHYDSVSIGSHSMIFALHDENQHDNDVHRVRYTHERKNDAMRDEFIHTDVAHFAAYVCLFSIWALGGHDNTTLTTIIYVHSWWILLRNAFYRFLVNASQTSMMHAFDVYIDVHYVWLLGLFLFAFLHPKGFVPCVAQGTFWLIAYTINMHLGSFDRVNLIISVMFCVYSLSEKRKNTSWWAVFLCCLHSIVFHFIPWMGFYRLEWVSVRESAFYFSWIYLVFVPLLAVNFSKK